MAKCKRIRAERRKVCIGDLRDLITVNNRAIVPPNDSVDYTMSFTDFDTKPTAPIPDGQIYAMIKTVSGEEIFDGHNVVDTVTHHVYIPFIDGITEETWLTLPNGRRLNIVDVQNLDERSQFLLLKCSVRGPDSQSNNAI